MLNEYLQQIQRQARDKNQQYLDPQDLISYINRARREVAMRSECIRVLTPISGAIVSATVTNAGTGYTAPTVTISAPDFPSGRLPFPNGDQATGLANLIGGSIASVDIQYGGAGYFQPTITIDDPTGVDAEATLTMSYMNLLNEGQEAYPFSAVDLSAFPGVESIYMIKSVSIIYSNYRYSLGVYSFSTYQAKIRNYPFQYQYVPVLAAQNGIGSSGEFYLYPLPSQPYQIEFDCFCLPIDLIDDQSPEAIPQPYTDAVPFLSLYYVYAELQNWNVARFWKGEFDEWMKRYAAYSNVSRRTNPNGRW